MSYARVIPRDLFNEASLLKCYGALYIATEGNKLAHFSEESVNSFDVIQRQDDGFLYVANLPFIIGDAWYRLVRPLNSREPWPLYAERLGDDDAEAIPVFDGSGNLSEAMEKLISKAAEAKEPGLPWCAPCSSYHMAPRDKAHHAALQCFAPFERLDDKTI